MERIDLDHPRFTQAQILRLVPTLSAKDLQNWVQRGVFEVDNPNPGRQGKRLYTSTAVIALKFMSKVTALGIGPASAYQMVPQLIEHAKHVHEMYPAVEGSKRLEWVVAGSLPELHHRGYIFKWRGQISMLIRKEELGIIRMVIPDIYLTVELDLLILSALNRIYGFLAGDTFEASSDPLQGPEFDPADFGPEAK